jgi:hypothetical protein
MKNIRVLVAILLLFGTHNILKAQGDINVVITEGSLTNTLQSLLDYARYGTPIPGVEAFGMRVNSISLNLKNNPNENVELLLDVTGYVNINPGPLPDFQASVAGSLTAYGVVQLQSVGQGYQAVVNLQGVRDVNVRNDWFGFLANKINDLANGFIRELPPISFASGTSLLPAPVASYFTSGTPTLTITDDAAIFSLTLSDLPRQITVRNDYSGNFNFGNVSVQEDGTFNSYPSPYQYFAPISSLQTIRAEEGISSYQGENRKYKQWRKTVSNSAPTLQSENPLTFTAASDATYNAQFNRVLPVTMTNSLEGGAYTGGAFIVGGQTYQNPFNDYLFQDEDNQVISSANDGTLGTNWSFLNWSDGVTTQTRLVNPSATTALTANYKGNLISSISAASSQSGQRRYARSEVGILPGQIPRREYLVYESFNNTIWLTYSTNSGQSWSKDIYVGFGNSPSVAVSGSFSGVIVWNALGQGSSQANIGLREINGLDDTVRLSNTIIWPDSRQIDFGTRPVRNARPAVINAASSQTSKFFIVYEGGERQSGSGVNFKTRPCIAEYDAGASGGINNFLRSAMFGTLSNEINAQLNLTISTDAFNGTKLAIAWQEEAALGGIAYTEASYDWNGFSFSPILTFRNIFGTTGPYTTPTIIREANGNKHLAWEATYIIGGSPTATDTLEASRALRRGILFQTIAEDNQSVSPNTLIYSNATNYRKPSLNIGGTTLSMAWQTDLQQSMYASRQLTNPQWYSFGTLPGWSSPNLNERGIKRFAQTSINSPYQIGFNQVVITNVIDPPADQSRSGISSASKSSSAETNDELLFERTDSTTFSVIRTETGMRVSKVQSNAFVELRLCETIVTRRGEPKTYYAALLADSVLQNPKWHEVRLASRSFRADSLGTTSISASVQVSSKNLTQVATGAVAVWAEAIDATTNEVYGATSPRVIAPSDTLAQFTMTLPSAASGKRVRVQLKTSGLVVTASHELGAMNRVSLIDPPIGAIAGRPSAMSNLGTETEKPLPKSFALKQNYPNPFNPTTVIDYELPSASKVQLSVYDVLGRKVMELFNGDKPAGYHQVKVNGMNLASGIYFYRLQAGTFVQTKKMLLVK